MVARFVLRFVSGSAFDRDAPERSMKRVGRAEPASLGLSFSSFPPRLEFVHESLQKSHPKSLKEII
jgi:hypothetical protein